MIATLLILAAAVAPPVQVEIDGLALPEAELQQLHGQLLTRLVEEGQAIGRPGVVTLRLVGGAEAVRVEVQHGRHVLARTVRGEGAVLRLAVTHAAIELLEEMRTTPAGPDPALAPEPERTLVVEATAEAEVLLPAAIEAAIEAGMVVSRQAEAGRRLCLSVDEQGEPQLGMVALPQPCAAERPLSTFDRDLGELLSTTPLEPTRTEPLDDAGEHDDDDLEDEPVLAPAPEPTPTRPASESPPQGRSSEPRPRSPWILAPSVAVGAQARLRTPEVALLADLVLRHRGGAQGWLRFTDSPSRGGTLLANDAFVAAGFGWCFTASSRVSLQVGLLAGVAVHSYAFEGDRGTRVDLDVEVPLELDVHLGRRVALGVLPLVGWTSRDRRHMADDRTLWSRERLRLGAALGLRVMLPVAGNSTHR